MCLASAVGFLLLTVAFLACGIGFLAPYWIYFPGRVADDVILDKARSYVGDKRIKYDGMLGRCFANSGCVFFFQNDFEMEKEVKGTQKLHQCSTAHTYCLYNNIPTERRAALLYQPFVSAVLSSVNYLKRT